MKKLWKSGSLLAYSVLCLIALGVTLYSLYSMQVNLQVHNLMAWIVPAIASMIFVLLLGQSFGEYFNQDIINTLLTSNGYTEEIDIKSYVLNGITNKIVGIYYDDSIYLIDLASTTYQNITQTTIKFSSRITLFDCVPLNSNKDTKTNLYIIRDRSVPLSWGGLRAYRKPRLGVASEQITPQV